MVNFPKSNWRFTKSLKFTFLNMRISRMRNRQKFYLLLCLLFTTIAGSVLLMISMQCKGGFCKSWRSYEGPERKHSAKIDYRDELLDIKPKITHGDESDVSRIAFLSKLSRQKTRLIKLNYGYMVNSSAAMSANYHFDAMQELRKEVADGVCTSVVNRYAFGPKPPIPGHLLVDDAHELIFCQIRKVASITWRQFLDGAAAKAGSKVRRLSTYNDEEKAHRLKHYTKVMFVREPILRAISGWYNKFIAGDRDERLDYLSIHGCEIAKRIQRKNTTAIKGCNMRKEDINEMKSYVGHQGDAASEDLLKLDIPFEDFAKYLVTGPVSIRKDMHFQTYNSRCQPCQIKYDYIGHYETLAADAAHILRRVGIFPPNDRTSRFPAGTSGTETLAKNVLGDLDSVQRMRLAELYDLDYELFGYDHFKLQQWADMVGIDRMDYDPFPIEVGKPRN